MSSTPLSEERQNVRFSAPRAWLRPESFGLKPEPSVGLLRAWDEEGRPSIEMAAQGSTSVGLLAEIVEQLHHNRYIRRNS